MRASGNPHTGMESRRLRTAHAHAGENERSEYFASSLQPASTSQRQARNYLCYYTLQLLRINVSAGKLHMKLGPVHYGISAHMYTVYW